MVILSTFYGLKLVSFLKRGIYYMNLLANEIIAKRVFLHLYIYLDIVFLVVLLAILIYKNGT